MSHIDRSSFEYQLARSIGSSPLERDDSSDFYPSWEHLGGRVLITSGFGLVVIVFLYLAVRQLVRLHIAVKYRRDGETRYWASVSGFFDLPLPQHQLPTHM